MTPAPSTEIRLREARIDELPLLGDLCLRSKAVWGYDAAFLLACRDELTITPEDLERTHVRVAESRGEAIGVAQVAIEGQVAELVKLFVEPDRLGQGCGRILLDWAVAVARGTGAVRMTIDSDPGAVAFYTRNGARQVGLVPSGSIPGRFLPRLEIALSPGFDLSGSGGATCSDAGRATMKTYSGIRGFDGLVVTVDGAPLPEHYEVKRFTTWGFEWTYEGDSPRQLSLAILFDHLGDGPRAIRLSEAFMRKVVADLDNDWTLTGDEVQRAIDAIEKST
jgi:GNAT superfamily N-acetyltransferase